MDMNKIDASGMSCPQPVLMAKKALEKNPETLEIVVDNKVARDNIERFLDYSGYEIQVEEIDGSFIIQCHKSE